MLPLSLGLVHKKIMPLIDVLAALTYKPADIIHVEAGRLKKGAPADLTLIDLEHSWQIEPDLFSSKSHNSPFDHTDTKGRAIRTIIGGETVYTYDSRREQKAA
jgi:dihydroorotase